MCIGRLTALSIQLAADADAEELRRECQKVRKDPFISYLTEKHAVHITEHAISVDLK